MNRLKTLTLLLAMVAWFVACVLLMVVAVPGMIAKDVLTPTLEGFEKATARLAAKKRAA